jgi:hypothetical protein
MGLDTKTYWLTDRQSQCNFDSDFDKNNNGRSTRTSKQEDRHGKLLVEEELEVGLWRLTVWLEVFIYVQYLKCVIQWDCYGSRVINPWRPVQMDCKDWYGVIVNFVNQ